jgi:peptide/nickel transport system permease protein
MLIPTPLTNDQDVMPVGGATAHSAGPFQSILEVFVENKLAIVGVGIAVFMTLFCFVGPLLYHTNQVGVSIGAVGEPPSLHHLLGTDNVGYDELGRLMLGGQTSLEIGFAAALLATTFGVVYGALAAFAGGWIDSVMMRIVDALFAIPVLFLLLFLASIVTPTVPILILVIGLISWLIPARLLRAEALSLRTRDYILAVRAMGGGPRRIIVRHIIPNAFGVVVVNATFQVADAILAVASLSYLGLGVPPPATNWGQMLSDGTQYTFAGYWWLIWPAGTCIVLIVVAFNFMGDAVRDALEVRLQHR